LTTTPASVLPHDVYDYISDTLAQLADLAGEAGSDRLERSLRLLALEAAAEGAYGSGRLHPSSRRN
jgi:hypothetical protein